MPDIGLCKSVHTETDDDLSLEIDYMGTANPVYIGEAAVGTQTSSAAWRIRKVIYSGAFAVAVHWASGTDVFDKVWDQRLSYAYS